MSKPLKNIKLELLPSTVRILRSVLRQIPTGKVVLDSDQREEMSTLATHLRYLEDLNGN